MKKIYLIIIAAAAGMSVFSCQNFLTTQSAGTVDNDFVFSSYITAKTVIYGAYNTYINTNTNSNGMFNNIDVIGSDVERCSVGIIADLVGASQLYGGQPAYTVENYNIDGTQVKGMWANMYNIISKCNQVIYNIEGFSNYDEIISTAPNDWSDLLGQAYALRATIYYDLARYFGDSIYMDAPGKDITTLSSRDYIIEKELAHLYKVEPLMYSMGQSSHYPDQMTRNYVDGLIGRLCFMEAGYQTRRTDLGDSFYTDADGKALTFDVWGTDETRHAQYARRSDWKKFYTAALPYLKKGVEEPAGVVFTTVDPRSDKEGRTYGNPFQYYFEQVNDLTMADETVYEVAMKAEGGGSRIAYNYGRGSNGGGTGYPPKSNAQSCSFPHVFYGLYDPQDMRRDVSVNVTGSTGNGMEILYSYALSNKVTLGIGMNKYDLNRQANPDNRQLQCGINFVQMRQADVILMYAEALVQTGDETGAKVQLRKVHDRAFPATLRDSKFNELLASCGNSVLEAVYKERELEFVGEGLRRWDLVRTGKLPEVAVSQRKAMVAQIAEMKANGYVKYANGNEFPAYVWTKMINAKKLLGYRLMMQTPSGLDQNSDAYALQFPGWRGQHDDWYSVALEDGKTNLLKSGENYNNVETNVAIMGLTKHIEPGSAEALALEARGYVKTGWGIETYSVYSPSTKSYAADAVREARWGSEFMCGYSDSDLTAKRPPVYLNPMEVTVCATTGLTNGYGFKSAAK